MRSSLVIASAVLVACSQEGGVELVIKPTDQTTRIALFVGKGDPITQNISPAPNVSPYLMTESWLRDPNNDKSAVEGVAGQPVTFGLLGPSDPLSIIIAVGFTADSRVASVAMLPGPVVVPGNGVARFSLDLQPVSSVDQSSPFEVHVWEPTDPGAPGDPGRCALVLDKPSGNKLAVVSENDQDCDGWPANDPHECVRSTFMSGHPPRLDSSTHCALPETFSGTAGASIQGSVLGGDNCIDGTGLVAGCEPSNYCLPRSDYEACLGDFKCLQDISTSNNYLQATRIHCTINTDGAGHLCPNALPIAAGLPSFSITRAYKSDSGRITAPGHAWNDHVTVPVGTVDVTLTIAQDSNGQPTITPQGNVPPDGVDFGALVAGDLDNGRGIAFPVTFEVGVVGCSPSTPQPCAVQGYPSADGLGACVESPLVVP